MKKVKIYEITNNIEKTIKEEGEYKAFIYRGYKCRIIRRRSLQGDLYKDIWCLNGYVGLNQDHIFYKEGIEKINLKSLKVHTGISYASKILNLQPEKRLWWIGFACAGLKDFRYPNDLKYIEKYGMTYKTMDFIERELKNLVKQLEKANNINN